MDNQLAATQMHNQLAAAQKGYQEVSGLALSGYQLLEAMLKTYLRNYFEIVKYLVDSRAHFGFSGKDYDNAPLGTLLKIFAKTCADHDLVKDLQAEVSHRNHIAHQASLVIYRRQQHSSSELNDMAAEIAVRAKIVDSLLKRLDQAHFTLVAPYRKELGPGA
jgi:hypothetical protein